MQMDAHFGRKRKLNRIYWPQHLHVSPLASPLSVSFLHHPNAYLLALEWFETIKGLSKFRIQIIVSPSRGVLLMANPMKCTASKYGGSYSILGAP